MKINPDLLVFLQVYDNNIQQLALKLREFIINTIPSTNELIWDNYNAVAIAYSKSDKLKDAFCHIAIYQKHVNFGFNRGVELTKNSLNLNGKGKLIRHISIDSFETFPKEIIQRMIFEAVGISETLNDNLINQNIHSMSKVMSVSKNKRRQNK